MKNFWETSEDFFQKLGSQRRLTRSRGQHLQVVSWGLFDEMVDDVRVYDDGMNSFRWFFRDKSEPPGAEGETWFDLQFKREGESPPSQP